MNVIQLTAETTQSTQRTSIIPNAELAGLGPNHEIPGLRQIRDRYRRQRQMVSWTWAEGKRVLLTEEGCVEGQ